MKVKVLNAQIADYIDTDVIHRVSFYIPRALKQKIMDLIKKSGKKHNGYVCLEISTPRKPRSTGEKSQCNHFNGHVRDICEDTGNEFADVKLYLKRRAFKRGYPFMRNDAGDIVFSLNDGEPLPRSEADATIEEAATLIEEAHELAGELGIILTEV